MRSFIVSHFRVIHWPREVMLTVIVVINNMVRNVICSYNTFLTSRLARLELFEEKHSIVWRHSEEKIWTVEESRQTYLIVLLACWCETSHRYVSKWPCHHIQKGEILHVDWWNRKRVIVMNCFAIRKTYKTVWFVSYPLSIQICWSFVCLVKSANYNTLS